MIANWPKCGIIASVKTTLLWRAAVSIQTALDEYNLALKQGQKEYWELYGGAVALPRRAG